ILAGESQGRGKDAHRTHELVDRDPSKHSNVLEHLLCQRRPFLTAALSTWQCHTREPGHQHHRSALDRRLRHHVGLPSRRGSSSPMAENVVRSYTRPPPPATGTPKYCVLTASLFHSAAGSDSYTIRPRLIT